MDIDPPVTSDRLRDMDTKPQFFSIDNFDILLSFNLFKLA